MAGYDVLFPIRWLHDLTTGTTTRLARTDPNPNTIDLTPDGRLLFASCRGQNNRESYYKPGPQWGSILVFDALTGEKLDAIVAGNQPTALDVSDDGQLLAYSDMLDNRISLYRIPPMRSLPVETADAAKPTDGSCGNDSYPTHSLTNAGQDSMNTQQPPTHLVTTIACLGAFTLACSGVPEPDAPSIPVDSPDASGAAPPAARPAGTFSETSAAPAIPDHTLAHAIQGPFGPGNDCILGLYESPSSSLQAQLQCAARTWSVNPLTDYALYELDSVQPKDMDGDGQMEIEVKGQYMTGAGPQGAIPFTVTTILRWDGTQLTAEEQL